jgi:hypothetical protein
MAKLRYRYRNGSPKQRTWPGAHEFAKSQRYTIRPDAMARQHPVSNRLRWERLTGTTFEARVFEHAKDRDRNAYWKRSCLTMKEHGKVDGYDYKRPTRRRKTRSQAGQASGPSQ